VADSHKYGNEQLDFQLAEKLSASQEAQLSTEDSICTPNGGMIRVFEHLTMLSRDLQEINTRQTFKS
jgi:hypothetical protein